MTGAVSPAVEATSTKCALNGRPDAAGLAIDCALWVETPCTSNFGADAERRDPTENCMNERRVRAMKRVCPVFVQRPRQVARHQLLNEGLPAGNRLGMSGWPSGVF